jgi:capsular exopolysaccharide synthesis family protein
MLHNSGYNNGHSGSNPAGNGYRPPVDDLADDEISLREIFDVLLKGKWIILSAFSAVLLIVAGYTFLQAPKYESSATLFVSNQGSSPQLGQLLGLETGSRNISNEIEILRSRRISERVAERLLDLRYLPGSTEALSVLRHDEDEPEPTTRQVVERLRRSYLAVRPVSRDVDMIELTVTSTMPEEAALIANLYASEYVDYNQVSSRARMRASREFLGEQTERLDSMLTRAESDIMVFSEQSGVIAPEEEARQILDQVMDLERRRYDALFQLRAAEAEREAYTRELDQIRPGLANTIASTDNQFVQSLLGRITQLQMEIEERLSRNPELRGREASDEEIMRRRNQIAQLNEQLIGRTNQLTQGVIASQGVTLRGRSTDEIFLVVAELQQRVLEKDIEVRGAEARLEVLNSSLEAYRVELNAIPNKSVALSRLTRNLQTSEQLFTNLYGKLQEARIAELSEIGYVEVIDQAIVPYQPVSPRVSLNLLLGAVMGMMLGVGLAFVRNAVDNRVRKPEDLRKQGHTIVGVVASMSGLIKSDFGGREHVEVDGQKYSTSLVSLLNPLSPISESYRRIRTNLQFSRPDKVVQTVLFTSPGPGEGKSVTSFNTAITMAQSGRRTVHIDADLRRPTAHKLMHMRREPGLVDILFEDGSDDFERFATDVENLYVIPAGKAVPNPSEILGSRRMRDLLTRLRDEFDVIVIDTPPVLAVSDAMLLAPQSDGCVCVCSAGDTKLPAVDHALEALRDVGAPIAGIVINRFDARAAYGGYGYGYGGYGYAEYYGDRLETESTPLKVV